MIIYITLNFCGTAHFHSSPNVVSVYLEKKFKKKLRDIDVVNDVRRDWRKY